MPTSLSGRRNSLVNWDVMGLPLKTGHSVKLITDNKFNGVINEYKKKIQQTI